MTQRREATSIDLSTWPEFDAKVLEAGQRNSFLARRRAIEMYCQHLSINDIESETGIDRSQLYRLLDRCARPHDDGRIFGYRALVPYSRVAQYERISKTQVFPIGGSRGTAGAFSALIQKSPSLADWVGRQIQEKRISITQVSTDDGLRTRLRGLKPLHLSFLRECRALDIKANDYLRYATHPRRVGRHRHHGKPQTHRPPYARQPASRCQSKAQLVRNHRAQSTPKACT